MATRLRAMIVALVCLALAWPSNAGEQITGVASIIDGDTLEIHGTRIRLHGIDAPESAQTCKRPNEKNWRCGQEAALALAAKVGRQTVACEERDKDQYGRSIAICTLDGEELNAWLVFKGWAVAFRRYSDDYVVAEESARGTGAGIWSATFEMPWDYRARRWTEASTTAPNPDCPIKGNINRKGERIYHTPWGSRHYDRTKINTSKGERWFCDEGEAAEAGWRAPYH